MGRVFANGLGDLGSIPGRVIPKTFKMVLDTSLLSNIRYISREKWSNRGKGVAPSPTPRCRSYWKGESSGRPRLRSPTLLIIRFGRLAQFCWSVCISKSQGRLYVSFSRTDSGLNIYHLFVWSNCSFLHNFQWITLPTQSCLILYSFRANLLHLLIDRFVSFTT